MNERLFRSMLRIRRAEEEIARLYPTDKIKSPVHLSIGQEPVSVGVCEALRPTDSAYGTYRSHALYLAKGGDLKKMMAELWGKATGCAGGKGGSMHLVDVNCRMMGTSAVVGTTLPIAVGAAQAAKLRKKDDVVVVFFGDGAVDEGVFHESMNYAALKKLPVLFVCENNFYAIHSHHLARHHGDNLCERARSYGMPAERIDDNDADTIFKKTTEIVAGMRAGKGPFFLECITYRWLEHVGPNDDVALGYRTREEVDRWKARDFLGGVAKTLPAAAVEKIRAEVEREVAEAIRFAEESPFPDKAALFRDQWAGA